MSLRSRLAIAVGLLVALAIALAGGLTVITAEGELIDEVDEFLQGRADQVSSLGDLQSRRPSTRGPRRLDAGGEFLENLDASTQVLDARGDVVISVGIEIPVDGRDREIAAADPRDRSKYLRTAEVDGERYRVITVPTGIGALQIARDLAEIEGALGGLTRRTILLAVAGSGLAALAAWALASRVARPVVRLTKAAEHVAATQDLSSEIEIEGQGEIARLAGSFNTMLGALDTSRQQQRRLVMDASHELRTPLTSLRTNVDVLARTPDLDRAERRDILDAVGGELEELTALVTELVDLATASSRPDEPPTTVDLGALAGDVAERFARRSGRAVSVQATGESSVVARASMLDRAVSNLVDNALKFSPADRPVEIMVTHRRVAVRDHGAGVAPEDRSRIFDRFYRSDETRTMPGSGLGLAIVHEVVAAHGGHVFVEDPPGGDGTVIGFELPG